MRNVGINDWPGDPMMAETNADDATDSREPTTVMKHHHRGSQTFSGEANELLQWFGQQPRIAVAFSGGVDSSVVLAAAAQSGSDVIAMTASSPSVAKWQLDLA